MFKVMFETRFVRATVIVGVLAGVAGGILLARDVSRSCMATDPELISIVGALKGDSFLFFSVNAEESCDMLQVTTSATLRSKQP